MVFEVKYFDELTPEELHDIFKLRVDVFVVEQNCPYPEIDGKDVECLHVICRPCSGRGDIVAYARLLPPGLSYPSASIGRVIVHGEGRGAGLGKKLLQFAIDASRQHFDSAIEIGAQAHLEKFYGAAGFVKTSDVYLEDGIPHIDMKLA